MSIGVSRVSFGNNDFQTLINSDGKYSNKPAMAPAAAESIAEQAPKKKGKAGKIILGTLATAVGVGLALFGLKRGNILKVNPEATGIMGKALNKLAEAGEWIGTKAIDPLVNLVKPKRNVDALVDEIADQLDTVV